MSIGKFVKNLIVVEYEEDEAVESKSTNNNTKQNKQMNKVTRIDGSREATKPQSIKKSPRQDRNLPFTKKQKDTKMRNVEHDTKKKQSTQSTELQPSINSRGNEFMNNPDTKVCLFEPRVFSETQDIADEIKQQRASLVNLSKVDQNAKKRIIDFLSGTVYALEGDIQKVGSDIFLCTPNNFGVEGEIKDYDELPEEM